MGGAGIGSCDDWSAIYWNPAGLAQVEGSSFAMELHYIGSFRKASQSLRNVNDIKKQNLFLGDFFKFPLTVNLEPDYFSNNSVFSAILFPALVWYQHFQWGTLAVGAYGVSGNNLGWKDKLIGFNGEDVVKADIHLLNMTTAFPISYATKLGNKLMVGVNLVGLVSLSKKEIYKGYQAETGSIKNTTFRFQSHGIGYGISADFGLMYEILDDLTVGAVLKSPFNIQEYGESTLEITSKVTKIKESSPAISQVKQSLRTGLGIGYKVNPNFRLAFDIYWIKNSDFSTYIEHEKEGKYLAKEINPLWDLQDHFMFRFGTEIKTDSLPLDLRFGFSTAPSPFKSDMASLATPSFRHVYVLTFGLGYQYRNMLDFSACYIYHYGPERSGNNITVNGYLETFSLTVEYLY